MSGIFVATGRTRRRRGRAMLAFEGSFSERRGARSVGGVRAPEEPFDPSKIGDGKSPVPDADGDYPAETYDLDGRKSPDTSAERNTEKHQGWTPVAARLPAKRIEVSTVHELIKALGSNRTIVVEPGVYVWRDGDVLGYAKPAESYDKLSKHWRDGTTIVDVENLGAQGESTGDGR